MPQGTLFIVSAPSGAGKTSLVFELLKKIDNPLLLDRVVTYTSRPARISDIPGIDYHFITPYEFEQRIKENFFLEWSFHYGFHYGSPASLLQVLQEGKSLILILDPTTAYVLSRKLAHAIVLWIDVASPEILLQRLKARNTESSKQTQDRIKAVEQEIDLSLRPLFVHHRIMNDDFNAAVEKMKKIICAQLFLSE